MRTLRFELMRTFHNKWMYISMFIGTAIVMTDFIFFDKTYKADSHRILIQAWVGTDFQFVYNSLFYTLFPLIACIPYAGTYYSDVSMGYDKAICVRTSRGNYMLAKMIAVFISAFAAITIPLLLNLYIVAGKYPNGIPDKLSFITAGIIETYLFSATFNSHPVLYALAFICIDGLFAGLMGLMSVAIFRCVRSRFAAIVFPFVIYILTGVVLEGKMDGNWSVMQMINPVQNEVTYPYQIVSIYVILLAICIGATWVCSRKRDIL